MAKFPGVYAQVVNNAYSTAIQGQFTCGLVGPAQRGPFNTAVQCNNINDFVANFGYTIANSYLSFAVSAITAFGNQVSVVRVGRQYTAAIGSASGTSGSYNLFTSGWASVSANQYLRVTQTGLRSTNNTQVSASSSGTITLTSAGAAAVALADNYTAAAVSNSTTTAAAAPAEVLVQCPNYGAVLSAAGAVLGTKGTYSFTITGSSAVLSVGQAIKITQASFQTTREAVIASIAGQTITLISTTNTATGQQAVPLQDSYTAGSIFVQTGTYAYGLFLSAATAGSWANSTGAANNGLVVNISPGANQDTKKLLVYYNGALMEQFDNLTYNATATDNFNWLNQLTGDTFVALRDGVTGLLGAEPPANTLAPWTPGATTVNISTFAGGADGANINSSDVVGTLDVTGTVGSGLQVLADPNNYDTLYTLAAPCLVQDANYVAVHQALVTTSGIINALAVLDVPDQLTGQQANDFVNGQGAYALNASINNFRGSYYWDWFQMTDPLSGTLTYVPPSVGVLSCMSRTFNQFQPWFAAAGEQRGTIPVALGVRYPRVSQGVLNAMQAPGSALNPIMLYRGNTILNWGDLTALRTSSTTINALQSCAVVHLCNYLVKNMSAISRRYIFDPNDPVLASQLTLEFNNLLQQVQSLRGITQYALVILQTPAMVNNRSLTVNLNIIPVQPCYEIDLNIIVNSAGATLNTISGVGSGSANQ